MDGKTCEQTTIAILGLSDNQTFCLRFKYFRSSKTHRSLNKEHNDFQKFRKYFVTNESTTTCYASSTRSAFYMYFKQAAKLRPSRVLI